MTYRLIRHVAFLVAAGFAFGFVAGLLGSAMQVDPTQWLIAAGVGYVVGAVFK